MKLSSAVFGAMAALDFSTQSARFARPDDNFAASA
jgi:hypothetical protein